MPRVCGLCGEGMRYSLEVNIVCACHWMSHGSCDFVSQIVKSLVIAS